MESTIVCDSAIELATICARLLVDGIRFDAVTSPEYKIILKGY